MSKRAIAHVAPTLPSYGDLPDVVLYHIVEHLARAHVPADDGSCIGSRGRPPINIIDTARAGAADLGALARCCRATNRAIDGSALALAMRWVLPEIDYGRQLCSPKRISSCSATNRGTFDEAQRGRIVLSITLTGVWRDGVPVLPLLKPVWHWPQDLPLEPLQGVPCHCISFDTTPQLCKSTLCRPARRRMTRADAPTGRWTVRVDNDDNPVHDDSFEDGDDAVVSARVCTLTWWPPFDAVLKGPQRAVYCTDDDA